MGRQAGRRGSGGTTAERQSGSGDGEAGDGREAGVVVVGAAATGVAAVRVVVMAVTREAMSAAVFSCLGGHHDGVGRVGLGLPVGFFPLFTPEFSQQKKNFSAQITMSTLPKSLIWCL